MKKNFVFLAVTAMLVCLFVSCKTESVDDILSDMENQLITLEKLGETITINPEKVFSEMEKWQDKFMETAGKLEKYSDVMTPEQITRLYEIFTKGSTITENMFN